jgi:N-formylglutamate amidohydrolase
MPHPNDERQDRPARSKQIVVLHIPHSSRHVPQDERQAILLDDAALNDELLRMTDAYTDELFPITPFETGRVVFPVSRLICDVERFPSDEDEPMAARGMGVFYTGTSMGERLREQPSLAARQLLLDRWYWWSLPHCRLPQLPIGCSALRVRPTRATRRFLHRYGFIPYASLDP